MSFEIKLPLFEGPFDLLLFFIERDELDIYDIPIARITDEFLEYLRQLDNMNIDVASEFIVVAATLMRIKAKMLLPRPQLDPLGQEIDPREELVRHLLEYKKFKSVILGFSEMEGNRLSLEKRGNLVKEIKKISETNNVESELQDLDLFKLLRAYEKVLYRFEIASNVSVHKIVTYPYTIEQQKEFLINKLKTEGKLSFLEIIAQNREKIAVIFNFMAILELLQLETIKIQIGLGFNNFWIEQNEAAVIG